MTDLLYLDGIYLGNVLLINGCFFLLYIVNRVITLEDETTKIASGLWITVSILHWLLWFFPAFTIAFYLLLGTDYGYLYINTADLNVFFIEFYVANASFILHSLSILLFWYQILQHGLSLLHILMAIFYSSFAVILEYMAWMYGINAIKYIDPAWDVREGPLLYPSFFHDFLKENNPIDISSEDEEVSLEDGDDESIVGEQDLLTVAI